MEPGSSTTTIPSPRVDTSGTRPLTARQLVATLALFVALAVVHTWPLASAPGMLSRNDTADTVLHEWTLAWVAHQIVHQPLHLFDANIFYPEAGTLAYSDHMLIQSLMGAPMLWSGASPVLVYNILLMAGFALTGWAMAVVVFKWTGSWTAGIMSGSLAAFNALTLTRLPQLQDQHLEFFPLALVALDALLVQPRLRHALALAGWFVLQALTCGYLLVFMSLSLVAAVAVRPSEWTKRPHVVGFLALAGTLSVIALVPFLIPYLHASRDVGLTRSFVETARYSAAFRDYLATGGSFHFQLWSRRFFRADALFPGIVGLGLALVPLISRQAFRDRRARMALAFGVVAFALSFGPAFPPYRWVAAVFPLMRGIRGAVRFGQFFLLAIAVLAGYGLARLQNQLRRASIPVCVALVLVAHFEALRAPLSYYKYYGVPPVYEQLRHTGPAVLAFFPFYGGNQFSLNTRYMLVSTRFWTPMLNGYSGYAPPSFNEHAAALANFPDKRSLDYLRAVGVNFVVVEGHMMRPSQLAKLPNFPELQLWGTDGNLRIFSLR